MHVCVPCTLLSYTTFIYKYVDLQRVVVYNNTFATKAAIYWGSKTITKLSLSTQPSFSHNVIKALLLHSLITVPIILKFG